MNWTFWFGVFWWACFLAAMSKPWEDPSEKAMGLFLSWLTLKQRQEYLRFGYFYVIGSDSGKTYRINKAVAPFNVEMLDSEKRTMKRLCFVPHNANFTGDIMLAQKIGLETDELRVLKVANDYSNWANMITLDAPA